MVAEADDLGTSPLSLQSGQPRFAEHSKRGPACAVSERLPVARVPQDNVVSDKLDARQSINPNNSHTTLHCPGGDAVNKLESEQEVTARLESNGRIA